MALANPVAPQYPLWTYSSPLGQADATVIAAINSYNTQMTAHNAAIQAFEDFRAMHILALLALERYCSNGMQKGDLTDMQSTVQGLSTRIAFITA
jgi:hypothetical protein